VSGLNKNGGINFGRKTNFGEPETPKPIVEEPKEVVVKHSQEQTDRQIRLEAKLQNAKAINYSGFTVNGGSVMTLVFGLNSIIADPNTLTMLNQINDMFGLDINFEMVLSNIEAFKMQLIGIFISIQTLFVGYQDTCKKMKEQDTESFMKVINGELEKMGI
jgi:hypothetical protein